MLIHLGVANLMQVRQRAVLTRDRSYLDLTGRDDYAAIVHKLGQPAGETRTTGADGVQYRALVYPAHRFTVILMGSDVWTLRTSEPWTAIGTRSIPRVSRREEAPQGC